LVGSLLLLSNNHINAGGPWVKKKGTSYIKLSEWFIVFDEHYNDTGLIDPNVTTGIYNTFLYAEYGLTNRLTGVVNANLLSRNFMNNIRSNTTSEIIIPGEAINSIGDIDVGLKYGLTNPSAPFVAAASITLGLPTGVTGKGDLGNLQTGDGEFNQILRLDGGKGFNIGKGSAYTSVYAAFNNRTNGFSDEFRAGAELGWQVIPSRLWISGKFNLIRSLKNGDSAETVTSTSIFANNTEFTSLGVEANLYVTPKFGLSASYTGALDGRIIAAAPSYSAGIFFDIN